MKNPRFMYTATLRKPDGDRWQFTFANDSMELAKDHIDSLRADPGMAAFYRNVVLDLRRA